MAEIQISEATEEIVDKIKRAMGLGKDVPKWIILRLGLARSLALEEIPNPGGYPVKGKPGEYHLKQVTGMSKTESTDPLDKDYTDHFIALITEHRGVRLSKKEAYEYLQAHISRGLEDIGRGFKEGENIFEYLYQELFYPLEQSSEEADTKTSALLNHALVELHLECDIEKEVTQGPRFLSFLLKLSANTKMKDVQKAKDEIEIRLGKRGVIIEQALAPGYLYIRIPKTNTQAIHLLNMLVYCP